MLQTGGNDMHRLGEGRRAGAFAALAILCALCFAVLAPPPAAAQNATNVYWNADYYLESYEDRSFSLYPRVFPADADYDYISFDSDNTRVATIESRDGGRYAFVRARNEGYAWLTVRVHNYDGTVVSDSIRLRVYDRWGWSGIGVSFGGGGCSAFSPGLFGLILPVFGMLYRRRK